MRLRPGTGCPPSVPAARVSMPSGTTASVGTAATAGKKAVGCSSSTMRRRPSARMPTSSALPVPRAKSAAPATSSSRLARGLGCSGSRTRSHERRTSSASIGLPSLKVSPSRSRNSIRWPSSVTDQVSASAGRTSDAESRTVKPSNTCETIWAEAESEMAAGSHEAAGPATRTMSLSAGRWRVSSSGWGVTMNAAASPAATMMTRSKPVPRVAALRRRRGAEAASPEGPSACGAGPSAAAGPQRGGPSQPVGPLRPELADGDARSCEGARPLAPGDRDVVEQREDRRHRCGNVGEGRCRQYAPDALLVL